MLGAQQKLTDSFQVRVGYNYGKSPVDTEHIFANVLFPAIVEHHLTAGMNFAVTDAFELGLSGYVTPNTKSVDSGSGDNFSSNNAGSTLWHRQYGGQVSMKVNF